MQNLFKERNFFNSQINLPYQYDSLNQLMLFGIPSYLEKSPKEN